MLTHSQILKNIPKLGKPWRALTLRWLGIHHQFWRIMRSSDINSKHGGYGLEVAGVRRETIGQRVQGAENSETESGTQKDGRSKLTKIISSGNKENL